MREEHDDPEPYLFKCDYCNASINLDFEDPLLRGFEVCCECATTYCSTCAEVYMEVMPRKIERYVLNDEQTIFDLLGMYPDHYYCEECFVLLEEKIQRTHK